MKTQAQPKRLLTTLSLPAFGLLFLTGCKRVGPGPISRDRNDSSSTLSESWKRRTLLDTAKLRYPDPPNLVDIDQIIAGYSLETALSAGGSFDQLDGNTASGAGSARYTDRPTITCTPLTGNQSVQALMPPLPPESVWFTIQSGWPGNRVLLGAVAHVTDDARRNG